LRFLLDISSARQFQIAGRNDYGSAAAVAISIRLSDKGSLAAKTGRLRRVRSQTAGFAPLVIAR